MQKTIIESVELGIKAIQKLKEPSAVNFMEAVAQAMVTCYERGGKVMVAGNGGSLCDAMHFAEELTGFFRSHTRMPLAAMALADPGHMSCVSNDAGFEQVFARPVQALGKPEDMLVVLTTSGNSLNLVKAVDRATEIGMTTVAFLGKDGGLLRGICDHEWIVSGFEYSDRVQEAHMTAIHIIIEVMEKELEKRDWLTESKRSLSMSSSGSAV